MAIATRNWPARSADGALGKWHHGESNELECLDGCELPGDGLSDEEALKRAREHIAATGHFIEQSRTIFRFVNSIRATT